MSSIWWRQRPHRELDGRSHPRQMSGGHFPETACIQKRLPRESRPDCLRRGGRVARRPFNSGCGEMCLSAEIAAGPSHHGAVGRPTGRHDRAAATLPPPPGSTSVPTVTAPSPPPPPPTPSRSQKSTRLIYIQLN